MFLLFCNNYLSFWVKSSQFLPGLKHEPLQFAFPNCSVPGQVRMCRSVAEILLEISIS